MLYRISVAERGLTGIANIFRSRLSRLDDLLRAGTVPLMDTAERPDHKYTISTYELPIVLELSTLEVRPP